MLLWQQRTPRRAVALGMCFGAGYFGAGTWWLYTSIHDHAPAHVWLSLTLVIPVVAFMACYYGLLGWFTALFLPAAGSWRLYAGLPAAWLFTEWLRGWVLSGFPWLSLGYSQTDSWLAAYAPVLGVYGVSALLLLQGGGLLGLWQGGNRPRLTAQALVGRLVDG